MIAFSKQTGFIRTIVLIVVAILVLSYFGIDLQKAVESTQAQKNLGYVQALVVTVWDRYLKGPATYLWGIFTDLIWAPSIDSLKKIKAGQRPDLENQGPKLPPAYQYSN